MATKDKIEVREVTKQDIKLVADYWLTSDRDFLISMGVDINKLPTREGLTNMLLSQIKTPDNEKASLALILEINGIPAGHCNVNPINYGQDATLHLHIWNSKNRQKGLGTKMVLKSLPVFFDRLDIQTLWCEPYALNSAPNKTLEMIGFEFIKKYVTVPGTINFEQEVNRYKLTKEKFQKIRHTSQGVTSK